METFILSKQVHFLPIPETKEFVAYHSFFGNAVKIGEETRTSLLSIESPLSRRAISRRFSISKETSDHLVAIGFLESSSENLKEVMEQRLEKRLEKAKNGMLIRSLRFLSSGCNISCSYCSIGQLQKEKHKGERFTLPLAIAAIERFLGLVKKGGHKTAYVRFFGGEPILDWRVFRDSILFLEKEKEDVKLEYTLNTNGMLITDEIAGFLKDHPVTIVISLDGTEDQHDKFRRFRNGSGTYSSVERGIEILRRNGVPFKLNAVLHNGNIDHIEDLVSTAKYFGAIELGIDDLCFIDNDGEWTPIDVNLRIKALITAYEIGKEVGIIVSGAWTGFRSFTTEKDPISYCYGDGEELCVDAKGRIFPCYGFTEPIGTLDHIQDCFSNSLYLELATRIPGNIPFCDKCEFQGPCAGECAAEMASIGNSSQILEERCRIRKELFKHLLISSAKALA